MVIDKRKAVFRGNEQDFFVFTDGRIEGLPNHRIINSLENKLYVRFDHYFNQEPRKNIFLAACILETFTGEFYNHVNMSVRYKDGNSLNVSLDNLEFVDRGDSEAKKKEASDRIRRRDVEGILRDMSKEDCNVTAVIKKHKTSKEIVQELLYDKKHYAIRCGYNIKQAKENFTKWNVRVKIK